MMYKNKNITVLSHSLVWFILFSMPLVLSYGQTEIYRIIAHYWIPILFYAIIFYLNYFFLIGRLLFNKKTLFFIGVNLVMIALFIALKEQIENSFFKVLINKKPNNGNGPPVKLFLYIQTLSYLAPLLFSIAMKTTEQWVKTEAETKEAANFKLQSELKHLHYQLQPHFFFNSLNNIYSLVDISPELAKTNIHSLSKLMRYMLYETNFESVSLSKEIDFMKKYIDLMKLRISDKTEVNFSFPKVETGITIAPLLFISLIENAFKHGISASKESHINIFMTTDANKKVFFIIDNDNYPKKSDDKSGSGIGLQNLTKRLQLLYPSRHRFEAGVKNNLFSVNLEIETT